MRSTLVTLVVFAGLVGVLAAFGLSPAHAVTTFTVNSTNDTNGTCDATECTLREAITAANATAGADAIRFSIPGGGVQTITPGTALPAITQPVTIDGYSQPGASVNTLAAGTNAVLLIEIDGNNAGFAGGVLRITGGGTNVRGLVINNSPTYSIEIATAGGNTGNTIAGNFIGTDPTGTIHRGQNIGVLVRTGNNTIGGTAPADRNLVHSQPLSSAGAIQFSPGVGDPCSSCSGNVVQGNLIGTNAAGTGTLAVGAFPDHGLAGSTIGIWISSPTMSATIGGTTSAARNVISGNRQQGIRIDGGRNNTIQGNYIGTNATGTAAIANGFGIQMEGGSTTNNTIGGTTPGAGNLISGNQHGLWIRAFSGLGETATGNVVQGNLIGTDVNGTGNLGNRESGVLISTGLNSNNLFGGTGDGAGNTVAFNGGGAGVSVGGSGNAVLGNSIFSNLQLGIDLELNGITLNDTGDGDTGSNNRQNFPVVTSASVSGGDATVSGTLNSAANTTFRLEFFASAACDASGFGEGQTYIGTANATTNASGNASFGPVSFPVPSGQAVITATATDPSNNTSEFSKCLLPPTARNDSYSTNEDAPLTVPAPGVLANDTDPESNPLTAIKVSDPADGSVTLNPNGSFTYTPNANFNGADSFTYKANDGSADGNTATVTITVNQVNDVPSFTNGVDQTVDEDSGPQAVPSFATNVSRGPPNESAQTLQFVVTNDNNGLFSAQPAISPTGTLTYTPAPNANGSALVTVRLRDNGGTANGGDNESDPQTVTITVRAANDDPVANDDDVTTDEGTPVDIDVKGNDSDPDRNALTVAAVSDPDHGAATINPDDTVRYVPDPAYSGPDSFTYTISDGNGGTATGRVEITVKEDPAPLLYVYDQQAYEDQEQYFDLGYFEDPGTGSPYTVTVNWGDGSTETFADEPYYNAHPWYYLNAQQHTYAGSDSDPSTPENDPYTVTVRVTEGDANPASDTETFQVAVSPPPPRAESDSFYVDEEGPLTVDAPGVLGNDEDPQGDPLTAEVVYAPYRGTLELRPDGSFTYTPNADFSVGYDYAYYRACDPGGACSEETWVQFTNEGPAANDDDAATDEDTPVDIEVLGNDEALYGRGNLDPSVITQPQHGAATVDPETGRITYSPDENYNGADEFTYEVCDEGDADGSADGGDPNPRCDTATVNVTVGPINDAPDAKDDAATTPEDTPAVIRVKDNDAPGPANEDGQTLTVDAITDPPAHGAAEIIASGPDAGEVRYTPNAAYTGPDSFEYRVCDDGDPALCDTATVTVTVSPASPTNDAPAAQADDYDVDEDGVLRVDAPGVLGNDTDADNDRLAAQLVSGAAHGTLELKSDGSFEYAPNADFNGTDTFIYRACDDADPRACSDPVMVTITVDPINDQPDANAAAAATPEDTPVGVDVLENDTDVEDDGLTVVDYTQPQNGTVACTGAGVCTYTPNENFNGTDTFTYTISDGSTDGTATVTVTITAANDAPVAAPDRYDVNEDGTLDVDAPGVLRNDVDADGDPLTARLVNVPAEGTFTLDPDGSFTYTPNNNFNGEDGFTYEACDGAEPRACSEPAAVTITVNPINDAPDTNDDAEGTDEDTPVGMDVLRNDEDVEGDALTVESFTQPQNGAVTRGPGGTLVYTPNPNFSGADSFTYRATDGGANSDPATVEITVKPVNDPPTISDIADRTIDANTDTGGIPFTITDPDTPADDLVLTASSGNETLVPGSGIVFGGTGGNRTVKVTPARDRTGEAEITVKVSDGSAEATDAFVLTVRDTARDTTAPTIECGAADNLWHKDDVSIECTASDGGSGLADPADAGFSLSTNVPGGTETGNASTGSRKVCDKAGNCATAGPVTGIKVDKKAPTLTCSASPKELWPPNHKLVTVNISVVVRDRGSGAAGFVLTSATSNEPDDGLGDGDTANDIQGFVIGTPDTSGKLRAERSGTGKGRVYTLSYKGADVVGNSASCNATVTAVPHDQGKK